MKIGRQPRVLFVMILTLFFFLLELIVGQMTGSVALVADSFHMLSDMAALVISFQAIRLGKSRKPVTTNTYGWQRAEQLGALVNSVFLIALCFSIFIEAIQRFVNPVEVSNPKIVLIVGGVGLVFNLLSMFLFGHAGHGHSHSHGGGNTENTSNVSLDVATPTEAPAEQSSHGHSHKIGANIRALFLHALGDALGNIGVIASALIIWLTPYSWRFYFDPIISILICVIILFSCIPLVRQTSLLLLQGIPDNVDLQALFKGLLAIEGVVDVHELHVWQLRDDKIVASVHLTFQNPDDYLAQASNIKALFHHYKIHSTTVQPEFMETGKNGKPTSIFTKLNPFAPENSGYAKIDTDVPQDEQAAALKSGSASQIAVKTTTDRTLIQMQDVSLQSCQLACTENCNEPRCCDPAIDKQKLRQRALAVRDVET